MTKHVNVDVPYSSAGDSSSVSLAIAQAGQKDQGLYYCCVKNSYGKVTAEFNLTAEGKPQLLGCSTKPWAPPAQRDTCPDPVLSVSFQFSNSSPVTQNTEVSDASGTGLPTQTRNSSPKETPCSMHSSNQEWRITQEGLQKCLLTRDPFPRGQKGHCPGYNCSRLQIPRSVSLAEKTELQSCSLGKSCRGIWASLSLDMSLACMRLSSH